VIRILLVDDHELLRAGLRSRLEHENGIAVVGEADSAERATCVEGSPKSRAPAGRRTKLALPVQTRARPSVIIGGVKNSVRQRSDDAAYGARCPRC